MKLATLILLLAVKVSAQGVATGSDPTKVKKTGDTMSGTLNVPNVAISSAVSIGTTTQNGSIFVLSSRISTATLAGDGSRAQLNIDTYGSGTGQAKSSLIELRAARGSYAAPTALQKNDNIGAILFGANDGTGFIQSNFPGAYVAYVSENQSSTNHGGGVFIRVVPDGSTTANTGIHVSSAAWVNVGNQGNANPPASAVAPLQVNGSNPLTGAGVVVNSPAVSNSIGGYLVVRSTNVAAANSDVGVVIAASATGINSVLHYKNPGTSTELINFNSGAALNLNDAGNSNLAAGAGGVATLQNNGGTGLLQCNDDGSISVLGTGLSQSVALCINASNHLSVCTSAPLPGCTCP